MDPRYLNMALKGKSIYSELNITRLRRSLMTAKEFTRLTGISKSRLSTIESRTSYIYYSEIRLVGKILNTTPEVISEGLMVRDNSIPCRRELR